MDEGYKAFSVYCISRRTGHPDQRKRFTERAVNWFGLATDFNCQRASGHEHHMQLFKDSISSGVPLSVVQLNLGVSISLLHLKVLQRRMLIV